jgi:hypothetical protein
VKSRYRVVLSAAVAVTLVAVVVPPSSSAQIRQWDYPRLAQRGAEGPVKVRLGGGYVGRVKFIDNLVAISQRFRNAKGKPRKRLYRVSGALSVRLKHGYSLFTSICKTKVPGAQLVPLRDGTRAFFPQQADEAPETAGGVNVGLNLGPFSVSVPVPGLDLYSGAEPPKIAWEVPNSSAKQAWGWFWNPFNDRPNDELLPFLGHWVRDAGGIEYRVACSITVTGFGASGGATIRMTKHVGT